jgi:hypothetical protein
MIPSGAREDRDRPRRRRGNRSDGKMFADEMGAALDLSPTTKAALTVKIAAAIEAAITDERDRLTSAQQHQLG